jgi:hypothetical protein
VERSAEPTISIEPVRRSVKNSNLTGAASSLPSRAFVPSGTVATYFVEIGRLAVGTNVSVLSSAHVAWPAMPGAIVSGGVATG